MELENTVEDQMCTTSCLVLLKSSFSWIVVVVAPLITFASFCMLGSFLSIFFTSTVLIFSTVLFILSKKKLKWSAVESVGEDIHKSVEESSPQTEDISASKQQPETETRKQNTEEQGQEGGSFEHQIHDSILKSPDILSENECVEDDDDVYQLSTTEGSEAEWPFRDNTDRTPDWSDDDDSLIEISLPGGHYVKHKEEYHHQANNKCGMQQQQKLPDFIPETIFGQRSLMELLAELNEMNEEENLIEIDISMGSIKYSSRFEIEA